MSEFDDKYLTEYPLSGGVMLEQRGREIWTNVPHRVMHHGSGYNWGYSGSGPAELALNILENYAYRPGVPSGGKVSCFKGKCSRLAWNLHQKFKAEIISNVPRAGGFLPAEKIIGWIDENWDGLI